MTVPGDEACEAQYKASPAHEHREDFLGIRVAERPWKPSDKGESQFRRSDRVERRPRMAGVDLLAASDAGYAAQIRQ